MLLQVLGCCAQMHPPTVICAGWADRCCSLGKGYWPGCCNGPMLDPRSCCWAAQLHFVEATASDQRELQVSKSAVLYCIRNPCRFFQWG